MAARPASPAQTTTTGHHNHRDRNFGLDAVRAFAIACVLVTHSALFMTGYNFFMRGFMPTLGIAGVELFFGLSGYLIGSMFVTKQPSLRRFYLRRFTKILPPYLMILVIIFLVTPAYGWGAFLSHLVFIQNSFPGLVDVFPVSWSLAIEFWFYALVPLIFIGTHPDRHRALLVRIIIILAAVSVARIVFGQMTHPDWEFGVHRCTPLRIDALIFGVLAAVIEAQHYRLHRIMIHRAIVALNLVASVVVLAWFSGVFFNYQILEQSYLIKSLILTAVGFSVMQVVLAAKHHLSVPQHPVMQVGARLVMWLSRISYSLYLVHLFVYLYMASQPGPPALRLFVAVIVSLTIASALYELFEVRIVLRWRRWIERCWLGGTSTSGR